MNTKKTKLGIKARKRKARRLAQQREEVLVARANSRRFAVERGWEPPSSDFPKSSRQSDPRVDRAALEFLDKKLANGGYFGLTDAAPRLVRVRPISELKKLKRWGAKYSLSRKGRHLLAPAEPPVGTKPAYLVHVRNWDHASEVWKTLAYVFCIPVGQRSTFNLDLSPEVALRAITSGEGPAKFLQDRIAAEIRRSFPPKQRPGFVMYLETSGPWEGSTRRPVPLGLHIHGAIERPSSRADVDTLKNALVKASGETNKRKKARMLHIKPAMNPVGWVSYMYKHRYQTAVALAEARLERSSIPIRDLKENEPVFAASAGLRSKAKAWHTARRDDRELLWVAPKRRIARTVF